jgi:hypothetical protein
MRRLAFIGGCLLLSTACAGGGTMRLAGAGNLGAGSRDVIRVAEHPEVHSLDVYQAVRRLRPFFLQSRGPSSVALQGANRLAVFLDDVPMGDVRELTSIQTRDIREIRYLSPSEAVIRYGRRFAGGIIRLTTH